MANTPYAIVGPDNKAINFITWNGVDVFAYGQDSGNYLVHLEGVGSYGFGWIYDAQTNTFVNPNPPPPEEPEDVV